jgi:hypothetical protein
VEWQISGNDGAHRLSEVYDDFDVIDGLSSFPVFSFAQSTKNDNFRSVVSLTKTFEKGSSICNG